MSDEHHGDHPAYLAHHFEDADQQFDSGKLGMWLFLATEVLLFGGLFCWYAIFRHHHHDVLAYCSRYLDTNLGAINTVVLILSSFTMALGVRAASLGQRAMCTLMLVLTLICAFGFLGIKYIEYSHKFHEGLMPGVHFLPKSKPSFPAHHGDGSHSVGDHASDQAEHGQEGDAHGEDAHGEHDPSAPWVDPDPENRPAGSHIFFSIYFMMTGLHGIHVLAGMLAILWALGRNLRGDFSKEYHAPVELVGLYWHLVDLIWIFLFPLLYLI
jgi:cytochrome c oxidase subunit 3